MFLSASSLRSRCSDDTSSSTLMGTSACPCTSLSSSSNAVRVVGCSAVVAMAAGGASVGAGAGLSECRESGCAGCGAQ